MKKTYNINIAGYGFVIDEDAYEILGSYLSTLSEVCRRVDEKETADDIERRIAEIFSETFDNSGARIISKANVEEVIGRMGRPEDILDVEVSEEAVRNVPPPFTQPAEMQVQMKKKLYRDINDKVLGGVCSGLGWYVGIDAVWIRVLAVVGIFLSASWLIWLYIVLWIIIPAAKTPFERMQMMGVNPSVRNVGQVVTGRYEYLRPESAVPSSRNGGAGATIGRIIMVGTLILALIVVGSIMIAMGAAFIGCLIALCISPVGGMSADMTQARLILGCITGGALTAGLPLFLLFRLLIGTVTNNKLQPLTQAQSVSILIAWIIGVAAVITCGILLHNL